MNNIKIIFILFFSVFLVGCFDKVELEERGIVLAIGIDKYNEKNDINKFNLNKSPRYTVSLDIPKFGEKSKSEETSNPMEGKNKESEDKSIKNASGESIFSTIDLIDIKTTQSLYFGHTKAIILGKELLKDKNLFKEAIDALERNNDINRKVIILLSNEKAKETLTISPKEQDFLGLYISEFYKNNKKNYDFSFKLDLETLIQNLISSSGDTFIPLIHNEDKEVLIGGLGVLKDYELVDILDLNTTKVLLWVFGKNSLSEVTVKFGEIYIPLNTFSKDVKFNFYEKENKIVCNINFDLKGNIIEYYFEENMPINSDKYIKLQKSYEEYINSELNKALNTLKQTRSDIFGIKEKIRKNNFDIYEKFNLKEKNIYDFLEFEVKSKVKIKGTGAIK